MPFVHVSYTRHMHIKNYAGHKKNFKMFQYKDGLVCNSSVMKYFIVSNYYYYY